jgi:hypothetical protein
MQERHLNLGISELIAQISIRVFFHVVALFVVTPLAASSPRPSQDKGSVFSGTFTRTQEKKRPNPQGKSRRS